MLASTVLKRFRVRPFSFVIYPWRLLSSWFVSSTSPEALPPIVGDTELLARYVLSNSWLNRSNKLAPSLRPNALMPHPRVELSVFRIDGWGEGDIVHEGQKVAAERERNHRERERAKGSTYPDAKITYAYRGRGQIAVCHVRATRGLNVISAEPPPRHADIVGWPPLTNNKRHDEAVQLAHALELVKFASFIAA
jgi:hypothetical protein